MLAEKAMPSSVVTVARNRRKDVLDGILVFLCLSVPRQDECVVWCGVVRCVVLSVSAEF